MHICNQSSCTGCMACMNVCPRDAIYVSCDARGFYRPQIDSALCIGCGLCKNTCPPNHLPGELEHPPEVYASWNQNETIRQGSSSGGVFSALADAVFAQDGVVCGAIFNDEHKVVHALAHNEEELRKLRGSKYVQSYVGKTYREVKAALEQGRIVLFSGTPCQIAGLNNYLGKDYENLFTIDLVCHGVPSPLVFSSYLEYLKNLLREASIKKIDFRNKIHSWTLFRMQIIFSSGMVYQKSANKDPFLLSFLKNYCLQESCHTCPYATVHRQGDITLGDFWGYLSRERAYRNDEKGISLVLVNTAKGDAWLNLAQNSILLQKAHFEDALVGNIPLSTPTPKNADSDGFWQAFSARQCIADCIPRYLQPDPGPSLKYRMRM